MTEGGGDFVEKRNLALGILSIFAGMSESTIIGG